MGETGEGKKREGEGKEEKRSFSQEAIGGNSKTSLRGQTREGGRDMGLEWRGLDLDLGWHMGWDRIEEGVGLY